MRAFDERVIEFESSSPGVVLGGTVCEPAGARGAVRARAAAVLLPGSGPQDRDETVAGHGIFRAFAHALAAQGVATLRVDDRGVGASGGDYLACDAEDIVRDAACAVRALERELGGVAGAERVPVGLIGHSQGCLIGALAAGVCEPAFLVWIAGSCEPGRSVMLGQHRDILESEGADPAFIERHLAFMGGVFDIAAGEGSEGERRERLAAHARAHLPLLRESGWADEPDEEVVAFVVDDASEWEVRFLLTVDGAGALGAAIGGAVGSARLPVLAVCGEHDVQVDARRSLDAIERVGNVNGRVIRTEFLAGLNHLLQACDRASSFAYRELGPPEGEAVAGTIGAWIGEALGA